MKRKAYSRGEREDMILDIFYSMVGYRKEPEMTAYGMAKALGLNSAQHVRSIMDDMCKSRKLDWRIVEHRPGVGKKVYRPWPLVQMLTEEKVQEPLFRINGKQVK